MGREKSNSYYKFKNMEFGRSRSATKLTSSGNNPFAKYEIGEMLGQGQFGKVYKARLKYFQQTHNPNEKVCAIKIIPIAKLKKNPKIRQLLTNEIHILTSLNHPHIIRFQQLFVWEEKIFMVYEYCEGGNLQEMLPLPQSKALSIFTKIIHACAFAERNHILHRDLKPANILFKASEPRVADWGFSRYLKEDLKATSFVGSPAYMAPQLLNGSQYTSKADVWSFGVMLFQCLFNEMPWSARNVKQLLAKVKQSPLTFSSLTSPTLKTILKMCLQIDPQKRASFEKLSKTVTISKRVLSNTESFQNPEQTSLFTELSQADIRKCSSYLQFAKQSQVFKDNEAKALCLELILLKLRKIKSNHMSTRSDPENYMTPCYSQRKMTVTKRQIHTPKTANKSTRGKKFYVQEESETHVLLNKQISLIEKMKISLPKSSFQLRPAQKNTQKALIKELLKKVIKNITVSQKSVKARKELMEMNFVLQIIMYDELEQEGKEIRISERIREMQELGMSALVRMVNCRVLYVNEHYCRH